MRIAIIGVGGVGGYFGGRLAAAGEDVLFVARGAHLQALQSNGLTIESANGALRNFRVNATDDVSRHDPVDVVMLSVKLWDTEAALEQARPLVGPNTTIVSFQNGVESIAQIRKAFGDASALGGTCHIAAVIDRPGVIVHTGTMARLTFGEPDGGLSARVEGLAAACAKAGFDMVASPDIKRAIWEKFVFLSTLSGMTALVRRPIGALRQDVGSWAVFRQALEETCAVARATGVSLSPEHGANAQKFGETLPAEMKSSMLGDLERGARLELPWLSGTVVKLGRQFGVPTPVHATITAGLLPFVNGKAA